MGRSAGVGSVPGCIFLGELVCVSIYWKTGNGMRMWSSKAIKFLCDCRQLELYLVNVLFKSASMLIWLIICTATGGTYNLRHISVTNRVDWTGVLCNGMWRRSL